MITRFLARIAGVALSAASLLANAPLARAQDVPAVLAPTLLEQSRVLDQSPVLEQSIVPEQPAVRASRPSLFRPFADVVGDIRHLPRRDNVDWLVIGIGAAVWAHGADAAVARNLTSSSRRFFEPGTTIGATPLQLGAAFATYAIGRATDSPRAMGLGADLIRAELLAELLTTGVKQTVRRDRPEGSGFSFPSGHTAVTFASATVFQKHFGWKAGIPAYVVAGYVAASRVQLKRHFLSDVAFGAAVGVMAGRTVTLGHGLHLEPLAVPGGGGAMVTWVGKP